MFARVRSKHMAFASGERTVALSSCVTEQPVSLNLNSPVSLNLLLSRVWSRWAPECPFQHQQFRNSAAHLSLTIFFSSNIKKNTNLFCVETKV